MTARSGKTCRPSALTFALLAPAIFACQEHFERLFHDGRFPWDASLHPAFVIGLLLQLPFAVATYLVVRLLLRVVRTLGRLLGTPMPRRVSTRVAPTAWVQVSAPRISVLARGYGSRGPPILHV